MHRRYFELLLLICLIACAVIIHESFGGQLQDGTNVHTVTVAKHSRMAPGSKVTTQHCLFRTMELTDAFDDDGQWLSTTWNIGCLPDGPPVVTPIICED